MNCLKFAVLNFLVFAAGWGTWGNADAWQASPAVAESDKLGQQQIEGLIEQLADSKFAVRESATRRLIAAGQVAVGPLKLAMESKSVEVRERVRRILSGQLQGVDSDWDANELQLIEQFKAGDDGQRTVELRKQIVSRTARTELILKLAEIELADAQRDNKNSDVFEALMAGNSYLLINLLNSTVDRGDWNGLGKLTGHPAIVRYLPMQRFLDAHNQGQLPQYAQQTLDDYRAKIAAGQIVRTQDLISLVGVFRVLGDFDRTEQVIQWLPEPQIKEMIRQRILFQQGDWREILRRAELDAANPEFISINTGQRVLLLQLLGDQAAIDEIVANLKEQLDQIEGRNQGRPSPPEDEQVDKSIRRDLLLIGMITLDWPLVDQFLPLDNPLEAAQLMRSLNRTDQAMQTLKIGPRFDDRLKWFQEKLKELTAVQEKQNTSSSRDNGLISEARELNQQLQILMSAVDDRGLTDEAELYAQLMFAADESKERTLQKNTLRQLLTLGRYESYWKLAESAVTGPDKYKFIGRIQFGINSSTGMRLARHFSSTMRGVFDDPIKEAKWLAAMVNSPAVNLAEVDFNLPYDIARYQTELKLTVDGDYEHTLSQLYEMHGDDQRSTSYNLQACQLSNDLAQHLRLNRAVARASDRDILDSWGSFTRPVRTVGATLMAHQAAKNLLNKETDPGRQRVLETQLRRTQMAASVQWQSNSRWLGATIRELSDWEVEHLGILPTQALAYGVNGQLQTQQQFQDWLASAMTSNRSQQQSQGVNERVLSMFDRLTFNSTDTVSVRILFFNLLDYHYARAKGMISQQRYPDAADLLVQAANFNLGDATIGEQNIAAMDAGGATAEAERVYNAVAEYYIKELKRYPDSPLARNNFAWLSACANRDLTSARQHVLKAIQLRPHTYQYLDTLAEIEFLLGDAEKAYQLSSRCVQLQPSRTYYRQQKHRFEKHRSANLQRDD